MARSDGLITLKIKWQLGDLIEGKFESVFNVVISAKTLLSQIGQDQLSTNLQCELWLTGKKSLSLRA